MNVYDFDKTIYPKDSTFEFVRFCIRKQPKVLIWLPYWVWAFFLYYLKRINKTELKQRNFQYFRSVKNIEQLVEEFWSTRRTNIFSWYLKQQKEDDVIISASPYFLLKPLCDSIGIRHLIASNVDCKTGKFTGLNCYGPEKVVRFYEVFPNQVVEEFYSDSYSDDPMAKIAKKAFLVKQDQVVDWDI